MPSRAQGRLGAGCAPLPHLHDISSTSGEILGTGIEGLIVGLSALRRAVVKGLCPVTVDTVLALLPRRLCRGSAAGVAGMGI
jgi:hypothetical protein